MPGNHPNCSVELSVTVWERTWRDVLTADHFDRIAADVGRRFERTTVTVNNVDDPTAVRRRLDELVSRKVIDGFVEVVAALPSALARTGLTMTDLSPLEHYSDHFLVKVCEPGPRFLVHWDTDVRLTVPGDWVTPSIAYLQAHPEVVVASVGWPDTWSMDDERLDVDGEFDLGYGFTDQLFLIDRTRFARPIYRRVAPASWWYPTSHIAPIFEQRVDAWMRTDHLKRAIYRKVRYFHDETMVDHPSRTTMQRVRRRVYRATRMALERLTPGFVPSVHRRPRSPVPLPAQDPDVA